MFNIPACAGMTRNDMISTILLDFQGVIYPKPTAAVKKAVADLIANYRVIGVTSLLGKAARQVAADFGIPAVYSAPELGFTKEHTDLYQRILDDHDLDPDDCVFLDDELDNLFAAQILGIRTVYFDHGDAQEPGTDGVVQKLSEFLTWLKENG
jgi:putative hydrolase of the HAD superfamily